jgi:hypothetical protein
VRRGVWVGVGVGFGGELWGGGEFLRAGGVKGDYGQWGEDL